MGEGAEWVTGSTVKEQYHINIAYRCFGLTHTFYSKQGKLFLARDMNGMRLMGDGISLVS